MPDPTRQLYSDQARLAFLNTFSIRPLILGLVMACAQQGLQLALFVRQKANAATLSPRSQRPRQRHFLFL